MLADALPFDLTTVGSTIAGYIPTVAAIAGAVFAGLYGIKVIVKVWNRIAK